MFIKVAVEVNGETWVKNLRASSLQDMALTLKTAGQDLKRQMERNKR